MNPVLGFVGLATLNMNNYLPTQFKPYLCLTSVSFRGTILLLVSNDIIKNLNQELAQKIFTLCKELAVSNVIQKFHVDKLNDVEVMATLMSSMAWVKRCCSEN